MSQAQEAWDKFLKSEFSRLLLENHPWRREGTRVNGWECRSSHHTQHLRTIMCLSFLHSSRRAWSFVQQILMLFCNSWPRLLIMNSSVSSGLLPVPGDSSCLFLYPLATACTSAFMKHWMQKYCQGMGWWCRAAVKGTGLLIKQNWVWNLTSHLMRSWASHFLHFFHH